MNTYIKNNKVIRATEKAYKFIYEPQGYVLVDKDMELPVVDSSELEETKFQLETVKKELEETKTALTTATVELTDVKNENQALTSTVAELTEANKKLEAELEKKTAKNKKESE